MTSSENSADKKSAVNSAVYSTASNTHQLTPGKLWRLKRLSDSAGRFKMTAVDQRPPIFDLIKRAGLQQDFAEVSWIKEMLTKHLAPFSTAMLLDPIWAYSRSAEHVSPQQGLLVTLEDHAYRETDAGRKSAAIADWTVEKIARLGADGVKVLAWYRPDAGADVCAHQREWVAQVGRACQQHDICFLFELLVYPLDGAASEVNYDEARNKRPQLVIDSVREFADPRYGIDLLKLESPVPAADVAAPDSQGADTCAHWFEQLGKATHVPWVMLSAGASMDQFEHILHYAYAAGASGFLAGRAIWADAAKAYPDKTLMCDRLGSDSARYLQHIGKMTDAAATPWFEHASIGGLPCLDRSVENFPSIYPVV